MKLTLVATCLFGLEHLLGEEIEALGYNRVETMDGRIFFEGDEEAVALSNVFLRYAEHVYIKVGDFHATTFDEMFEGVKALPWDAFIGKEDAFPVKGHSVQSALHSVPDCQRIIKRAVVASLEKSYGISRFPETGRTVQLAFFLFRDRLTVMIDTSGAPLYKRGYRQRTGIAPIRETLGAALAAFARPREEVLFWDPMCGSGTIAIEAAMLMANIAPGLNRSFLSEGYPFLGRRVFADAREEARSLVKPTAFEVYASDIDPEMVEITRCNAAAAGVGHVVKAFVSDARKIAAPGRRGTVVSNPPYGERMTASDGVSTLYRELGRHFASLAPWQIYLITSAPDFERQYGRAADKKRKLYNGMIPCTFYQYFKNNKGK